MEINNKKLKNLKYRYCFVCFKNVKESILVIQCKELKKELFNNTSKNI